MQWYFKSLTRQIVKMYAYFLSCTRPEWHDFTILFQQVSFKCFDFSSNRQGKQGAMQQPLSAAGNQPTRIVNQVKMFSSECRGGDHRWLLVMFLHVRMHHVCYGVNATTCIETKFHNRRYTCCA